MPRLSIWNSGRRSNNYNYFDRIISGFFHASGTAVYVHKYLGAYKNDANGNPVPLDPLNIQDVLFLENRDRAYDKEVYELRGTYNVQDNDLDLRQFGLFLTGDTIFMEVHKNDMQALIGRKIIAGDVIELPHLRDDLLLDPNKKAVNKYYVVEEAMNATDGFSSTWFPHIWRLKLKPMTASQEFNDILDKPTKDPFGLDDDKLRDIISTIDIELALNEEIVDQARANFRRRNFETQQFYLIQDSNKPWIFAGDGIPPNGAELLGTGNRFPQSPTDGDYFLRLDYEPAALFRYKSNTWRMEELDYRKIEWNATNRILESFINNKKTTTMQDGTIFTEKQGLSKAIRPRAPILPTGTPTDIVMVSSATIGAFTSSASGTVT